ncbi:hypothetical protein N431DRAFT_399116 [Stipitochalara longipes BDJ]|nr:hypothetical protein N431DRAFT_399116 [Stipitochalara longipes BDJ]
MDNLLPNLLSFPPHPPPPNPMSDHAYEQGIREQIEFVRKLADNKLLQHTSGGENVLDVINPALNTVPYTFILLANLAAINKTPKAVDMEKIWGKLTTFLGTFDPRQIRYLGEQLSTILEAVASIAMSNRQPWMAIAPIRDALLRLDPTGTMLTTTHLALVKLALESRTYSPIVPVIEKFILYFPGTTNQPKPKYICDMSLNPTQFITPASGLTQKLKYQEVLEYFLYSGMVFIGLSKWELALQCLENAVTYPAKEGSVSKIMAEAYKKWVLVGLLHEGRLLNLPRSTSSNAAKQYHTLAKPYETLAQIFESGTASRLKAEADQGVTVWRNDCNTGLVLHVLAAYQQFQIRNLANIYSKISIPEIVSQTMSAETGSKLQSPQAGEALVQGMINRGELHATMSSSPGQPSVVTFAISGPILTEGDMQRELGAATERIHILTKEIKQTDRMLTHDKEYIKFVQKQKKNAKQGGSGDQGISGADMDWGDAVEDEDIMSNLY